MQIKKCIGQASSETGDERGQFVTVTVAVTESRGNNLPCDSMFLLETDGLRHTLGKEMSPKQKHLNLCGLNAKEEKADVYVS